MLNTLGPVFSQQKIAVIPLINFVKQVKSFHILLELNPFIVQCSHRNTEYIKSTGLQDISIKIIQLSHSLFPP